MITKHTFKILLRQLNFVESGNLFIKHFDESGTLGYDLRVDFAKEELIYPEETGFKVNERQTCNFLDDENFVVFECVCRLLNKGYQPKHIELEPRWSLGHTQKGGRADILVRDNDGNSLLIIECKTAGNAFNIAWKDTLEDGAQLFSYVQQEKSTQFVALYASDFVDDKIKSDYYLIAVKDNEELLKNLKKEVPCFKNANNNKAMFKAWSETYQKDYATLGLFEEDIAAYTIGKTKYSTADLEEVDSDSIQKKYHEFATILRQHNVSGHENAFDKLVNLFLAKIVDETTNPQELNFYWKGAAYDDVKSLVDRMQKLYKIGMEKFLNEDVTYIEKSTIKDAFKLFRNDPDATQETILNYFDQLKYYTNNDFAFLDVHNEKLFYQNAEVLLKIVRMLQDIKLQTDTQNQFLGDLFEGFLDKGVKQSEGQFFTPMPIVKFLISSLPLKKIIWEHSEIPRVIDYACGAGHFLNEYANQISPIVVEKHYQQGKNAKWYDPKSLREYYAAITGIEKEYRLSKVAKVSAFMYRQDEIRIIYGDALAQNTEVEDGTFSVLVANPPYSVKGFLGTLGENERNRFELTQAVDSKSINSNNSIETFFVERAKQLLQPGGVAAIILPSSILSNGNIYTKMREILLKYFDIVAIAEFGSGTFGKTGTNTATLFLRRKSNNPDIAEHYQNRVNAWFQGDFTKDKIFEDEQLLQDYCTHISIPFADYKTLLRGNPNKTLLNINIFHEYRKEFEKSAKVKTIEKKKITPKYTQADKLTEIAKAWLEYLQMTEKEKLYFYMLAASNPQPVVIVKSPADNKAKKKYLGYDWSTRKGNEGIKYLGRNATKNNEEVNEDSNENIEDKEDKRILSNLVNLQTISTPLYNPADLSDAEKINTIIRYNFEYAKVGIPEALSELVTISRLVDMLDFSRGNFDKALKTTPENKIEITSKYPLVSIEQITNLIESGSRPQGGVAYLTEGAYSLGGEHIDNNNGRLNLNSPKYVPMDFYENANRGKLQKYDLLICKDGALTGKVALVRDELDNIQSMINEHVFILRCQSIDTQKYLFIFLFSEKGQLLLKNNVTGSAQGGLNATNLKNIKIPLPPLSIQKQIIAECEEVDAEYNTSRMSIEEYKKKIAQIFDTLQVITSGGGVNS